MIYRNFKFSFNILLVLVFSIGSCSKNESGTPTANFCDENKLPIVMLHGLLASGDTYSNFFQLFRANDYCDDALYVVDRNTLLSLDDTTGDVFSEDLDKFIDEVLSKTGAGKVNLVGHSAGGNVAYAYLKDETRATKVNRYAHLASFFNEQPAGPNGSIPTINIYSDADKIVAGKDIPGATNINLIVADHYQVATSTEAFQFVYGFFNDDKAPQTLQPIAQESIELEGKVLTLGENLPIPGATISVFELDAETGIRLTNEPTIITTSNAEGKWKNVTIQPKITYEFFVENPSDENFTPLHYYFEGFSNNNSLVYLRTIPPASSLAGLLLAAVPKDDEQAVMAIFTSTQAVINGRDELFINEVELSTPQLSSEEQSTIAMFLYDDADNQTTGKPHPGLFTATPFLNAVDVYMEPATDKFSTITFNGDKLAVPHWPSKSDGFSIVVFD